MYDATPALRKGRPAKTAHIAHENDESTKRMKGGSRM
jgi:hypothetical protein